MEARIPRNGRALCFFKESRSLTLNENVWRIGSSAQQLLSSFLGFFFLRGKLYACTSLSKLVRGIFKWRLTGIFEGFDVKLNRKRLPGICKKYFSCRLKERDPAIAYLMALIIQLHDSRVVVRAQEVDIEGTLVRRHDLHLSCRYTSADLGTRAVPIGQKTPSSVLVKLAYRFINYTVSPLPFSLAA